MFTGRNRQLLAVNFSIFAVRRRRNQLQENVQTRKTSLKIDLLRVLTPKNGKFKEDLKFHKIWTFYGTRANLNATQNRFALQNFPSRWIVKLRKVVKMNNLPPTITRAK